jgi:hypothetical protein
MQEAIDELARRLMAHAEGYTMLMEAYKDAGHKPSNKKFPTFKKIKKTHDKETAEEIIGRIRKARNMMLSPMEKYIIAAKLIREYMGMALTVRQYHYRIHEMSKHIPSLEHPNTPSKYNGLSAYLSDARLDGLFPWDYIIEDGRTVEWDHVYYSKPESQLRYTITNVQKLVQVQIDKIENRAKWYSLDRMLYQKDVVVILLEKKGLHKFFNEAKSGLDAAIIPCGGFPSTTQLNKLREEYHLETSGQLHRDSPDDDFFEGRRVHLQTYTDFDPSGKCIEESTISKLEDRLGVKFASVERITLTQEQVDKWNLPYAPVKKSDTRSANWQAKGSVEMDAIDPAVLKKLIRDNITKHFDDNIKKEIKSLQKVLKRKVQREADRLVAKIKSQIVDWD